MLRCFQMPSTHVLVIVTTSLVLLGSCGGSRGAAASITAASPGTTQNVPRTDVAPRFFIDIVGSNSDVPKTDTEIAVPASGQFIVAGWATDFAGQPVSGVEITVDQKPYLATYGVERQDVATALKNPSYTKSGFQFVVPASQLSGGTHTIAVRIINNQRNAYFETPAYRVRVQ